VSDNGLYVVYALFRSVGIMNGVSRGRAHRRPGRGRGGLDISPPYRTLPHRSPWAQHGIYVDDRDNVWLGAGGEKDAHVLKFTRDGRFLMQIGHPGQGRGSNDTENLGAPASMVIDSPANELYVADGYVNHRVIVFDAGTGAYKRHWGAYGNMPDDGFFTRTGETLPGPFRGVVQNETRPSQYDPNGPPSPQFRIVHAVRISNDGLVYVCDRTNDRLQVFRKDGGFVREIVIARTRSGADQCGTSASPPTPSRHSCSSTTERTS
jgi:NHL repeat